MGRFAKIVLIVVFAIYFAGCGEDNALAPEGDELFSKHPSPVWEGNWLAGDPSIIKLGDSYLMYYTSLLITGDGDGDNPENLQVAISVAESSDGITWDYAAPRTFGESVALMNDNDSWDRVLETAFVVRHEDRFLMYYTGYEEGADGVNVIVSRGRVGLAESSDGIEFTRTADEPVIDADEPFDSDGIFSPTIVQYDGRYHMIYTGWSLDMYGYGLFGATSVDGISWQKQGDLLISEEDVSWSLDNPRESELVRGPDRMFYLFFTSDTDQNMSAIGLARSPEPFGPWDVYPEPLVFKTESWEESGLIAPAVLIEDGTARIWYMAETGSFSNFYIGYAELEFPLDW